MKRIFAVLLILCLLLTGCGGRSDDQLVVEVQRETPIVSTEPVTEPETVTATLAVTEPTAIPTTVPTTEATQPPTEPPTEPSTEPPTEAPTEEHTEPPTEAPIEETEEVSSWGQDYVLNKNSKKFHYPHCGSVKQMKEKNRKDFFGSREEVLSMGYVPCKNCKP